MCVENKLDKPLDVPDHRIAELVELGMSGAMLIHELRQPIFSIRAMAQLAIAKGACDVSVLRDILTQVATMDEYVEHFSQTDASESQRFCAVKSAERAMALLSDKAKSAGVSLESNFTTQKVDLFGRPNSIFQAVTNLLSNAINALVGVENACIVLSVQRKGDSHVTFTVTDNGRGIPDDLKENLFEPFITSRAGAGGTGLGLYLTKQLVEGLSGQITVETIASGGAKFEITIPRMLS